MLNCYKYIYYCSVMLMKLINVLLNSYCFYILLKNGCGKVQCLCNIVVYVKNCNN